MTYDAPFFEAFADNLIKQLLEGYTMIDWNKPVVTMKDNKRVIIDTLDARGPYPVIGHIENNPQLYRWTNLGTGELFNTPTIRQAPVAEVRTVYQNVYADCMGTSVFTSPVSVRAGKRKGKVKIAVITTKTTIVDGVVTDVRSTFAPLAGFTAGPQLFGMAGSSSF